MEPKSTTNFFALFQNATPFFSAPNFLESPSPRGRRVAPFFLILLQTLVKCLFLLCHRRTLLPRSLFSPHFLQRCPQTMFHSSFHLQYFSNSFDSREKNNLSKTLVSVSANRGALSSAGISDI